MDGGGEVKDGIATNEVYHITCSSNNGLLIQDSRLHKSSPHVTRAAAHMSAAELLLLINGADKSMSNTSRGK